MQLQIVAHFCSFSFLFLPRVPSIPTHKASRSDPRQMLHFPPLQSPSSCPCSICRPPPFPHPARGWINVWLWETCRWQMFTFIMHDFHVAVNFSEPAKSRKWFCTLCLFNEIVTLMEVRLNKMEMTVSVCRFYDLFFFFISQPVFTSSPSPGIYGPMQCSRSWDRQ